MKLQTISIDTAKKVHDQMINDGKAKALDPEDIKEIGGGGDLLSDLDLSELFSGLKDIKEKYKNPTKINVKNIDAEVPELIHRKLSEIGVDDLCDLGFWRWLSIVAGEGQLWNFIDWRFSVKNKDKAKISAENWCVSSTGLVEPYFPRAWLRAHRVFDPNERDPYKYSRIGGVDVWRSHILRQDFGSDIEFVKAFLDTIEKHDPEGGVNSVEWLRKEVIPKLRSWSANASFSHLTYEENLDLIEILLHKER
tara:strand:+ start:74 stop:826 length:753 start_codon:yes stop_codon:yes gene_type:complete